MAKADEAAREGGSFRKFSKTEVNYSEGMPERHCACCEHFEKPRACELVQGVIAWYMWCKKFKKD